MNSIKTSLIIGISIFSLSLSGMRLDNPRKPSVLEQNAHDYTVTVRALQGFFEITQENREEYKTYFRTFGIELPEATTKVIHVKLKKQQHCSQQKITANSDKVLSELPALMPLNLFTYDNAITSIEGFACVGNQAKRITVQYRAAGLKQLGAFKPHTTQAKTVTDILETLKKTPAIANKVETIQLNKAVINLCDSLKAISEKLPTIQSADYVDFPLSAFPQEITKESLTFCLNLLEKYVTTNADAFCKKTQTLSLPQLTDIIITSDHLKIVSPDKSKKTTFLSFVHSTFLNKLIKEDDDSRTVLLKDLPLSQKNFLLHCFVTKLDLFDRLARRHTRLDTQAASIANRTMNNTINSIKNDPHLFMMSLEQALAIYDLLNEEHLSNKEGLITNLLVSHAIKPILDQCIEFEKDRKIGLIHQENQEKRIKQQELEEKKREEEAVYNSTRAKIGRFIHEYKNKLIIAGCGITLLSLALLYAQGYLVLNQ